MSSALLTILGISLLIFIHEFGHFICARMAGVKVHIFSLGFGPRLWGFQKGGTDYRISVLPLGGYVMVAGDDPTFDRRLLGPDDLCSKGFLARAFFYSGGVIMNVIFALIAFPLVFNTGVKFVKPVIGGVLSGGGAWEAGLQAGDEILRVDGKPMYSLTNFKVETALANSTRGAKVAYLRDGEERECTVRAPYSKAAGLRDVGVSAQYERGPFQLTVDSTGPAYRAGLRTGDVLLSLNGTKIFTAAELNKSFQTHLGQMATGDKELAVEVRRPLASAKENGAGEVHTFKFQPPITAKSPNRIGVSPVTREVIGLRDNPDVKALKIKVGDRVRFLGAERFLGDELALPADDTPIVVVVEREGKKIELRAEIPKARRDAFTKSIALGADLDECMVRPAPGSPAERAGLARGDTIGQIDGAKIDSWQDLVDAVNKAKGKAMTVGILGAEGMRSVTIQAERVPEIGFFAEIHEVRYLFQTDSLGGAIKAGCVASIDFVKQIYVTLKRLFTGDVSPRNLGGIITISRVSYAFAEEGLARLFYFLAILSINLAVINVLPIPVLDGGHLTFLLIEKIKGSPVSTKVHNYSQILGLVFVLALMVYVTYNDILRWLF